MNQLSTIYECSEEFNGQSIKADLAKLSKEIDEENEKILDTQNEGEQPAKRAGSEEE